MLQLLDFAGIYFRAFHAVPSSVTAPDGRPVNAIRGSLDIMARVIADGRPTRLVACLDVDWRPAWRVALVPSYKTHRVLDGSPPGAPLGGLSTGPTNLEVVPDELSPQIPVLLEVLDAIGIATAGAPECEADDVIGTLAATETDDPVEVVTGDRDLFQVAAAGPPPVAVRYIGAGMSKVSVVSDTDVARRHDIPVGTYADFAALRGDPSDGLPGVPGIGDKTAASLLRLFGSLDGVLDAVDRQDAGLSAAYRRKLAAARDYLAVAPRVVRVRRDAKVVQEPDGDAVLPREPADPGGLADLIEEHGIGGAVGRLLAVLTAAG